MPKLKNVTAKQLLELDSKGSDLHQELCDLCNHIEKQAIDKIADPFDLATSFLCLSQSAGRLTQLLLVQAELQGMRDHTEALRRELKEAKGSHIDVVA